MTGTFKRLAGAAACAATALLISNTHAVAQSAEEFYRGKTLHFMHVTGAGGTMDLYMLLVMKHIKKYLPEDTNTVLEQRPGGGGIVGTNYMVNAAPKDGTVIGMPTPSMAILTFARPEAAKYKADEMIPLGRFVDAPRVFVARADSGIETLEDAKEIEVTHGTMPPGSTPYVVPAAANEVIGTKFKLVPGYSGGGPLFVAMEQGEIQTTTAETGNLLSNKWHLVENGTVNVLAIAGEEKVEGLEDVPLWSEFMPEDHPLRGVMDVLSVGAAIGLGAFLAPGVPEDRVAYLRDAIEKTLNDPELLAEAEERNIPISYASAEFVAEKLKESVDQPDDVKRWFRELIEKK